jgi:hypothetical protein
MKRSSSSSSSSSSSLGFVKGRKGGKQVRGTHELRWI